VNDVSQAPAINSVSSSSFYAAMRILPRPQRDAMFAIYNFCRAVDDIADWDGPQRERLDRLEQWRADVNALYAGRTSERMRELAPHVRRFDLAQKDFLSVLAGMEMDVAATMRAPPLATLDLYCDCVASAVGRLSVRIFGMERAAGEALAHHLGRALQITNILRDLDEDAAVGRLYLPREVLEQAGIHTTDPKEVLASPTLGLACSEMVARAHTHFAEADRIMMRVPRRTVRAPRIMSEVYRLMLNQLVARGWSPPRRPVHLPRARLVLILLRYALV
jgi:phytoene synthase